MSSENEKDNLQKMHAKMDEIEKREEKETPWFHFGDFTIIKIMAPLWIAGIAFTFFPPTISPLISFSFYTLCAVAFIILAIQAYRKTQEEKEKDELDQEFEDILKKKKNNS